MHISYIIHLHFDSAGSHYYLYKVHNAGKVTLIYPKIVS